MTDSFLRFPLPLRQDSAAVRRARRASACAEVNRSAAEIDGRVDEPCESEIREPDIAIGHADNSAVHAHRVALLECAKFDSLVLLEIRIDRHAMFHTEFLEGFDALERAAHVG